MRTDTRSRDAATADRVALAAVALIYVAGVLLVLPALTAEPAARRVARPAGDATAAPAAAGGQAAVQSADTPQSTALARHEITFELKPGAGFEFKYRLNKGAGMVYSWSASAAVKYELHGEPDGAPAGYADTYRTGEDLAGRGTFTAPTRGIHGWYWENPGRAPVKVMLKTSGFYTAALELRASGPVEHPIDR